jgi:hypothetical protein
MSKATVDDQIDIFFKALNDGEQSLSVGQAKSRAKSE